MKVKQYKVNTSLPKKSSLDDLSYGDLIVEIGRFFINTPTKGNRLNRPDKEKLIVNLSAFDCTTFVETVLALTKCAAAGKLSHYELRRSLKLIRYRQGKIDDYFSRLPLLYRLAARQ